MYWRLIIFWNIAGFLKVNFVYITIICIIGLMKCEIEHIIKPHLLTLLIIYHCTMTDNINVFYYLNSSWLKMG